MPSKLPLRLFILSASLGGLVLAAVSEPTGMVLDPIESLEGRIQSGKVKLEYEPERGYLRSVLKELEIPYSSQTLVWTKTSLQSFHISPRKPRAIYFNEHSYVGWVNGGELIEIVTVHPEMGARFYSLRNTEGSQVEFKDEFNRCIGCHAGRGLGRVPRLLSKSVNANSDGLELLRESGVFMTPKTPLNKRWGGWYVSGTHGAQRHRGNVFASGDIDNVQLDMEAGANRTSLNELFDTSKYLSPNSDIVALMVMEHQMAVQNEISRTGIAIRAGEPINESCEELVAALILDGEAPLTGLVKGNSAFQQEYEATGRRDKKGRSLRDLDLKKRLFKYRVSPMILSPAFNGLPTAARGQVMKRLEQILTGKDDKYPPIPKSEREETLAVLADSLGVVFHKG